MGDFLDALCQQTLCVSAYKGKGLDIPKCFWFDITLRLGPDFSIDNDEQFRCAQNKYQNSISIVNNRYKQVQLAVPSTIIRSSTCLSFQRKGNK